METTKTRTYVLDRPEWAEAGWQRTTFTLTMTWGKERGEGLVHDDAPGLAVVETRDREGASLMSVTHVGTGRNAGIVSEYAEWPPCPVALHDVLRSACATLDYASLTEETALQVPEDVRVQVRKHAQTLYAHSCAICAWWHAERIPRRAAELEAEIERLRTCVAEAEDALIDAEHDLAEAEKELSDLKKGKVLP